MKRNLLLSIIIALCIPLLGNPVDETTAKQLTQNFWKENNIMGVRGDKVFKKRMDDAQFVNVAPQCGYSEFFIFNNENGKGFVIIAAEDCVTPILGYSYDNNFVADSLPSNLKGWLDGYAEQIQMAVEMRASATNEIRADWECLRQGKHLPIKSETAVSELLSTTWNQNYPYCYYCPYNSFYSQYTYTGCVATAMAQIMKYWEYPAHGYGFNEYYCFPYGNQSANFGNTIYDWSNMLDDYSGSYNSTQRNAVAELMYHCGVSVNMDYGVNESSAYIITDDYGGYREHCAEDAFERFFGYSHSIQGLKRDDHPSDWISILKNELNNNRPILYGGRGTGGHAFVCDGYNNSNFFHFNWGWGGDGQGPNNNYGYFNLNYLTPIVHNNTHNYSSQQVALIGIQPDTNLQDFDLVLCHDVEMLDDWGIGNFQFGQDISMYTEILNQGNSPFTGYVAAAVFDDEGYFIDFLGGGSTYIQPYFYVHDTTTHEGGIPFLPSYEYLYHTIMFYSTNGENWSIIEGGNYNNDGVFQVFNSGQEIVTNSEFTISTGEDVFYNGQTATVNVDIINEGTETYYGMVWTALLDEEGYYVQIIDTYDIDEGLPVNYHYTNGINFTNTITAPEGQYYLGLFYIDAQNSAHYAGSVFYPCLKRVYVINSTMEEDPYEPNNTVDNAFLFNTNFSNNITTISTSGANLHNGSDVDYYKINLNAGYDYTITPRLHDAFNSGNGNTYSVDGMFAYSTDGVNWSDFYDDVMTGNFSVIDGGTVYFDVISYFEGDIGTYLLSVDITRTQHTNSYTISVSANPSNGGTTTGGGTYNQGQSCTVSASANSGYTFVNWTENGTQVSTNANYTFTVIGNRDLVANFQAQPQQYTINISANPSNGGNVTGGGTYNQGQSCTVSATANSGYTFVNWTENGTQVSSNANYTFTVTSNRNLVAHFTTQGYVITTIADPSVGGIVTGSGGYNYGETCTLTATANNGYTFQRWTKNGTQVSTNPTYSFTVTESATYTAHFNAQNYTVTVAANPSNAGSVSGGGSYTYGQTCTVTASSNNGYAFTNWTENGSQVSTNASYSFTVTGNRNLVANFAQNTHTIHASAGANGIITPSGTITVAHGSNQSFSMIPNSDYEVQEVYIDGNPIGAMASYTFTNVMADHYIHVTFTHVDAVGENNINTINVYPNPTLGEITLEGEGINHVRIVNAFGQTVYSSKVEGKQVRIDLSNMAKGIYMMHIEANDGQAVRKIVVE